MTTHQAMQFFAAEYLRWYRETDPAILEAYLAKITREIG